MPDRTEGTVVYPDKKLINFPAISIPLHILQRFLQMDPKQKVNRKSAHKGQKAKAVQSRRKRNKISAQSRKRNR